MAKATRGDKQAYRPPRLTVHGDLRKLTQAKGGAKSDGGTAPKTKAGSG
jgi:hypothetical protein